MDKMLKERVDVGLKRIIDNGQYYDLFNNYYAERLEGFKVKGTYINRTRETRSILMI